MFTNSVDTSALFISSATQSSQLENMAKRAIARGLDHYEKKDYDKAIAEFKKSVGLSPSSTYALTAYKLIAQSYTKQNNADAAIGAYKQALRLDPSNAEMHTSLGNIYYYEEKYSNAVEEYKAAVRKDPNSTNLYSLAQGYLANGQYDEAGSVFSKVKSITPRQPYGDYGMGLVYAKQGRSDDAIKAFEQAMSIKPDYWEAYSQIGYVYADTGRVDDARNVVSELSSKDKNISDLLGQYVNLKEAPKLTYVASSNFFPQIHGPSTKVAALGSYLEQPNGSQTFSMEFYFSKPMDAASVENILNWHIGRAPNTLGGDGYNYGMHIPQTEVRFPTMPLAVNYDPATQSAKVWFSLRQNSSADGTVDLGHIQFTFSGKDQFGVSMSGKADQYTGFSGIA